MKFELGQLYRTRGGKPEDYAVVIKVYDDGKFRAWHSSEGTSFRHGASGRYLSHNKESEYDLIGKWEPPKEPVVKHIYSNVYKHCLGFTYNTLNEVIEKGDSDSIGVIKVTLTDGKLTAAEVVKGE